MKVSVIIPCYNSGRFIEKCLDSIICQTLKDIEIICINNASTDNTGEILHRYAQMHANVSIIELEENAGPGGARNFGILKALGEYISFVDSDDWVEPDMLQSLYNLACERDADIVTCKFAKTESRNLSLSDRGSGEITGGILDDKGREEYICFAAIIPWIKIYRRSMLIDNDLMFPPKRLLDDVLWTPLVMAYTTSIYQIDKVLYYNYIHPESITGKRDSTQYYELLSCYQWLVNETMRRGIYSRYKDAFDYRMGMFHYGKGAMWFFLDKLSKVELDSLYQSRLYIYKNHPLWRDNPYFKKIPEYNYLKTLTLFMDTEPRLAFIYFKILF